MSKLGSNPAGDETAEPQWHGDQSARRREIGLRSWFSGPTTGERRKRLHSRLGSAGDVCREQDDLVTLLTVRALESVKSMITSSMITSSAHRGHPETRGGHLARWPAWFDHPAILESRLTGAKVVARTFTGRLHPAGCDALSPHPRWSRRAYPGCPHTPGRRQAPTRWSRAPRWSQRSYALVARC